MSIQPDERRSEGLRHAGIVAWSLLGILLLVSAGLALLWFLREIFPPLLLAVMVIFLLNPLVTALQNRGVRRGIGTAAIYLLFVSVVFVAVLLLAPPMRNQIQDLQKRAPDIATNVINTVETFTERFGVDFDDQELRNMLGVSEPGSDEGAAGSETPPGDSQAEGESTNRRLTLISRILSGVRGFAGRALSAILVFVLAPIFALYLLIDLPRIQRAAVHYMPPRHRREWLFLLEQCGKALGGFFRGQLVVAAIVGAMSAIAFFIWDLPFWLPIGMAAGFFNIIPLVGPFVGGGIAVVVGGLTGGPALALKVGFSSLVVQQIDNHFISPNVMGRAVRLHPVMIMVALLAGGTLAGLWGMLLAVPLMAIVKILGVHYYETRVLGTSLDEIERRLAGESVEEPDLREDGESAELLIEPVPGEDLSESQGDPVESEVATGPRGRAARSKQS